MIALYSRRTITQLQLDSGELKFCRVVVAEPDGNCGFTAIRRVLLLKGRPDLAQHMYRHTFIHLVERLLTSESPEIQLMIRDIFALDNVQTFEQWRTKFEKSSNYVADVHLRLLSKHYNLIFHIYCIPPEHTVLHFSPEIGNEVIHHADRTLNPPIIELAHIPLTFNVQVINHFEGLILEPDLQQRQKIDALLQGFPEVTVFPSPQIEIPKEDHKPLIPNIFHELNKQPDKKHNEFVSKTGKHQRRNSAPSTIIGLFSPPSSPRTPILPNPLKLEEQPFNQKFSNH